MTSCGLVNEYQTNIWEKLASSVFTSRIAKCQQFGHWSIYDLCWSRYEVSVQHTSCGLSISVGVAAHCHVSKSTAMNVMFTKTFGLSFVGVLDSWLEGGTVGSLCEIKGFRSSEGRYGDWLRWHVWQGVHWLTNSIKHEEGKKGQACRSEINTVKKTE